MIGKTRLMCSAVGQCSAVTVCASCGLLKRFQRGRVVAASAAGRVVCGLSTCAVFHAPISRWCGLSVVVLHRCAWLLCRRGLRHDLNLQLAFLCMAARVRVCTCAHAQVCHASETGQTPAIRRQRHFGKPYTCILKSVIRWKCISLSLLQWQPRCEPVTHATLLFMRVAGRLKFMSKAAWHSRCRCRSALTKSRWVASIRHTVCLRFVPFPVSAVIGRSMAFAAPIDLNC
jgi:hypothetical protein